jgi:hypothetical protein
MKHIFLAGLLGGITMFIRTSIAHMALPLRKQDSRNPERGALPTRCGADRHKPPGSTFSRFRARPQSDPPLKSEARR